MTNPTQESLTQMARRWAEKFEFTVVGDCVHLSGGESKYDAEGKLVDAETFFDVDHRAGFRFLSALEAFVNHQHPPTLPWIDPPSERRAIVRRYIELCAQQLQAVADNALPFHPICVIPERYNEVVTAITMRPGNSADQDELRESFQGDEETRQEAVVAAGTYLVTTVVDALLGCSLSDPSIDVSVAATESLIEIAAPETVPQMRAIWTEQPNAQEHILRMAGMVLALYGETDVLIAGMEANRWLDQTVWTDIVLQLPPDKKILPILKELSAWPEASSETRWALADALAALREPGWSFASELVGSEQIDNRLLGCRTLFMPEAKSYRPLLEQRLHADEMQAVRYAAYISLDQMACPESFESLTRAMADSDLFFDGSKMMEGGIQNFIRYNPQLDIRPMLQLFSSNDPAVRARVLDSLEEIQSGEQRLDAKPFVESSFHDETAYARSTGIWLASVLNFTDLREQIQQIAWTDTDESVRDEAEHTLAEWQF